MTNYSLKAIATKNSICAAALFSFLFFTSTSVAQGFDYGWHAQVPSWDSYLYGYSEYDRIEKRGDTLYLFSEYYGDSLDVNPGATVSLIDDEYNSGLSGVVFVARYKASTGEYMDAFKLLEIPANANGGMTAMNIYDYDVSPAGKILVTGSCVTGVDFDGSIANVGTYSGSPAVSFVSFYESNGSYLGHVEYPLNFTGTPFSSSIDNSFFLSQTDVDDAENIYISGSFLGTVDLDFTAGIENKTSNGNFDCAVVKIDGVSETYAWSKCFGGINTDAVYYTAISNDELILIGSYGSPSLDLDAGAGTFTVTNPLTCCDWVFLSRLDANGNFINGAGIGGDTDFYLNSLHVDDAGNCYVLGELNSAVPFDLDPGAATVDPFYENFLVSYASDFSVNYVISFSESSTIERVSPNLNYVALGGVLYSGQNLVVHSSLTGESDTLIGGPEGAMFLTPLSKGSGALGETVYYPHQYDRYSYPYAITSDTDGNLYATGTFQDAIDFNPFDGISTADTASYAVNDVQEVYVTRLDWSGFASVNSSFVQTTEISLYPNPSNSNVVVSAEDILSEVVVYTLTGEIVIHELGLSSNTAGLDLSGCAPGAYMVKVILENGHSGVYKLIKN